MMNCFLGVDINCCNIIEEFVKKSSSLNLVGTCCDSVSIRDQISKLPDIDLVILDVGIPGLDVFSIISSLGSKTNVIVLSSDEHNALKAFEFNVVDYLLKPVTFSRFCKAVDKAIRYHSHVEVGNIGDNEIFIKKGATLVKLKLKEIIYIEALENYVTLYTKNEKFTIHFTMKAIEVQLPSGVFLRVHRSYIVNKSMIQSIKENTLDLVVGGEVKAIPLGKSYRDPLLNVIKVMGR
jgi:DNA-binding LytR/AlgR family response regulator